MSSRNFVGECVCRESRWLSEPRGESEPPSTWIAGETALSASYDSARSWRYAGAATFSPFGPNCGSQKRFRFGSFPIV